MQMFGQICQHLSIRYCLYPRNGTCAQTGIHPRRATCTLPGYASPKGNLHPTRNTFQKGILPASYQRLLPRRRTQILPGHVSQQGTCRVCLPASRPTCILPGYTSQKATGNTSQKGNLDYTRACLPAGKLQGMSPRKRGNLYPTRVYIQEEEPASHQCMTPSRGTASYQSMPPSIRNCIIPREYTPEGGHGSYQGKSPSRRTCIMLANKSQKGNLDPTRVYIPYVNLHCTCHDIYPSKVTCIPPGNNSQLGDFHHVMECNPASYQAIPPSPLPPIMGTGILTRYTCQ